MNTLKIYRDRVICKTFHQFFHFKCICLFNLPFEISHPLQLPFSTIQTKKEKKMSLKTTCLTYFVAIFAVLLASRHVIDPNSSPLKHIVDLSLATTSSVPSNIISYLIPNHIGRHHKKKDNGTIGSICDDFPRGFPPPDTNTTSYLCVDRNGCCNFTLVQAAVDAAPAVSQKRTIIWINNGLY